MNAITEFKSSLTTKLEPVIRPWLDKALDKWEELNQREQLIVAALGVTVVLALIMVLVIVPLIKNKDQAKARYENNVALLSWMQSVAPELKGQGGSSSGGVSAQSMMKTVNENAAAYQLKLERVQPEGDRKLRVWIQNGSFNSIMSWLQDLQKDAGIVAFSVNIDAEAKQGMVSAKVVLQGQ